MIHGEGVQVRPVDRLAFDQIVVEIAANGFRTSGDYLPRVLRRELFVDAARVQAGAESGEVLIWNRMSLPLEPP